MKRLSALVLALIIFLCGCSPDGAEKSGDDTAAECLKLARAYRGLDTSDTQAILDFLAGEGKCAVDAENLFQMANPELIEDYLAQRDKEPSAVLEVYQVLPDGGFLRYDIGGGELRLTRASWQGGLAVISMQKRYALTELKLTEKANLIISYDIPENPDSKYGHDGYIVPCALLKTKAPDPECAALCKKYVQPLGYTRCNLLTASWSAGDFSEIDFGGVYDRLFYLDTGKDLWDKESFVFVDELKGEVRVSAEDFTALLSKYLPVTGQELREDGAYSAETGAYRFFIDLDQAAFDRPQPYPEVTAFADNGDGTLTLTVDEVFLDEGSDCVLRSELTVNTETGHYISNRVLG